MANVIIDFLEYENISQTSRSSSDLVIITDKKETFGADFLIKFKGKELCRYMSK